jgi:uncharacterized protein (UPF0332 family)
MFDPEEFLQLANELCARDGQAVASRLTRARVRTAFGRAYYGLFLIVRSAISTRHGIPSRRFDDHGKLCRHLQNPRLRGEARALGRYLEHLYSLRQKADYDLEPHGLWEEKLADPALATKTAVEARRFARMIPALDFTPVIHLFDPRYLAGGSPDGELQ